MKNLNVNYNDGKFNIKADFSVTLEELQKLAKVLEVTAENVKSSTTEKVDSYETKQETNINSDTEQIKETLSKIIEISKITRGDINEKNTEK